MRRGKCMRWSEIAEYLIPRGLQLFGFRFELGAGEIQVIRTIDRHEVKMRVGHFEAYHGKPAAVTVECLFDGVRDGSREKEHLSQESIGHIEKAIHLQPGYDEGMSFA